MIRADELTEIVQSYNPQSDASLIKRAYVYGAKMHGDQRRADGSPYFGHPVEVAGILTTLCLDDATIATALLHDTLEDTHATREELVSLFGEDIAALVEGVTKLNKLEKRSKQETQAENFRKLLLATSKDVRVILVKLADRLHNMRTIGNLSSERKERIARETLDIFAPMAGRMGMQSIRDELEDLSFEAINPVKRKSIMRRFVVLRKERGDTEISDIVADMQELFCRNNIDAHVTGREKRPYSIWKKMNDKQITFEQLSDIVGFRVIVPEIHHCYQALGVIHTRWSIIPGFFKDYISVPKPNGYRSIHTTIMNSKGQRLEIQIRTTAMNEVAETGVAAHWQYKGGARSENQFAVDPFVWLKKFIDGVAKSDSASEVLENAKLEMFQDQVFCFTPKGKVVELPRGATALDFAYGVHTQIGDTCVGTKINGKRQPMWTVMRNGDTVDILRSDTQKPEEKWLDVVVSGRARSAIRRSLRIREQEHYTKLGHDLVRHVFARMNKELTEKSLKNAVQRLSYSSVDALMESVGRKTVSEFDILEVIYPGIRTSMQKKSRDISIDNDNSSTNNHEPSVLASTVIQLSLEESVRVRRQYQSSEPGKDKDNALQQTHTVRRIAACCQPVPGERIVGIIGKKGGLTIHAIDCTELVSIEDNPDLWVDVRWEDGADQSLTHLSMLKIVLTNKPGVLGIITSLIGELGSNIFNLTMQERMNDFYELNVAIEVFNIRQLNNIILAIEAQSVVNSVYRMRKGEGEYTQSKTYMYCYEKDMAMAVSLAENYEKFNKLHDVAVDNK